MILFEDFLNIISHEWYIDVLIIGKVGVIFFLCLYLIFTFVVMKQVKLMSKTVNGLMEKELLMGAKFLIGLAIVVLILAIVIL